MQRSHFAIKGPYSWNYRFSSSHIWMWDLDHKEGWVLKNCFRLVVQEKTLESTLDSKEYKPVNSQAWISIGRTVVEAEAPNTLGTLLRRTDSLEKTLMLGKTEGNRRGRQQVMTWLASITHSMNMKLSKLQKIVENRGAWHAAVHGAAKSQTWLSDWTTIYRGDIALFLCERPTFFMQGSKSRSFC